MTKGQMRILLGFILLVLTLAGCGRGYRPLIPTPVLYTAEEIDPFDHLPVADQTPLIEVFYATNRKPKGTLDDQHYGNGMDDRLHVGKAVARLGDEDITWDQLHAASITAEREIPVPVTVQHAQEYGVLAEGERQADFAEAINAALAATDNKVINVYVHGFKVDFDHGVALGAQLRHFALRSGVTIAFDWASRQSQLLYLSDIKRARRSVPDLVDLLTFLGRDTNAERIHVISWSAGAPIHSRAMVTLRERHPDEDHAALFARYRLDKAVFAASDIDFKTFVDELIRFYDLPRSIGVTICYDDAALSISRFVHGHSRLGSADPADLLDEQVALLEHADKLGVMDVTHSKEVLGAQSGFVGHRYWYDNSWVNSDLLVGLYLDIPPEERGLTKDKSYSHTYYFDADYPERVVEAFADVEDMRNVK